MLASTPLLFFPVIFSSPLSDLNSYPLSRLAALSTDNSADCPLIVLIRFGFSLTLGSRDERPASARPPESTPLDGPDPLALSMKELCQSSRQSCPLQRPRGMVRLNSE